MYSTATAANHAPSSSYACFHYPSQLDNSLVGLLYNPSKNDPMGDGSSTSFDSKGKGRAVQNGDILALDLNSAEEGAGAQGAFMQMQMVEQQACVLHPSFRPYTILKYPQDSYIQSRSTAIESIESTIAELGQIFTQLANMVAEQRETVQRIDADTLDIASNVMDGQRELLKYFGNMASNRWLMLKMFGVLIVFVCILPSVLSGELTPRIQFLVFILVS